MSPAVLLPVIALYLGSVIGASWWISRKTQGSADFFRGGRKSPWWAVAVAMVSTSISGITFVSVPGMVEASQWSYLQMAVGFVAGYAVIAYVLLPLYYRLNLNSLYSWLEQRFGRWSHRTGAAFFLLSKLLICGVRMYLTAIVLQLVVFDPLGIPFAVNVAATMFCVWLYTFRGGVRTLVWTDMIQTVALITVVVLCLVQISRVMGLDFGAMCGSISDSGMSRIWFFDDWRDTRFFWKQFLAGMFTTIAMTGLDQDMMQKNLSCKTLRESQRNMMSYGAAFFPVNLLFLALGVLLYQFAAARGISVAKPDDLFPTIACGTDAAGTAFMPPVVPLLFALGLTASAFSSSGSALTALTTTFTLDVLHADKRQDEAGLRRTRQRVHAGAAVVLGLVILGFGAIRDGSVINAIYTVAGYTYGPLLGLFFFGILTRRRVRDRWVPLICILSPVLCYILSTHSAAWLGGYRIGFELLLINAGLTWAGLWLCGIGLGRQSNQ
ncbi:MAG: sodium:solute symporter [Bacteroidales bacterium]|nr:sodium:solute symporter [Bacteroidales bacterium]